MDTNAVDLSDAMPVETIEYEVRLQGSTQGTGWKITLCDSSHPKALAYTNAQAKQRLRKEAMQEAAQVNGRKYHADERSPDEARLENIRWVVSRILDWTPVKIGFLSPDPIAFSDEAATRLFMHPKMGWAFAQLVDVLAAERSFTPRSAELSETSPSATSPSPA